MLAVFAHKLICYSLFFATLHRLCLHGSTAMFYLCVKILLNFSYLVYADVCDFM